MSQANEDPTRCVADSPVSSTCVYWSNGEYRLTQDPNFSIVCNKTAVTKSVSCPSGTTEWRTGYCYLDCPPNMVENGLSCLRRTAARLEVSPSCKNWLFWFDGTACVPNPFTFLILLSTFAAFILLATRQSSYSKY